MTILNAGPCEAWTPLDCPEWPVALAAVKDSALMAATEILWQRTQRRFGLCEIELRPCRQDCGGELALAWLYGSWLPTWNGSAGWGWPFPALLGGQWYNLGCGCTGDCSCTTIHQIALPTPVAEIVEIKVDGVVLDPSAYRVDDWRWLVRLDGEAWPLCQDLNLDDTEVGTWSITATYGEAVPVLGRMAVGELGLEIAKALCGDGSCQLSPVQTKSIRRQGVEKVFLTAGEKGAPLGLLLSDRFINTFNPTGAGVTTIYNIDG